jgi:hypothetical protein
MFSVYEIATGKVVANVQGTQGTVAAQVGEGQALFPHQLDPARHFVDHASGKAFEAKPMALVVDGFRIEGLPDGATINGVPAADWLPPEGELAPRVTVEAPRHIPETLVLRDYRALRAEAYPAAGEQLGALMKAFAALRAGKPVPADAEAVLAAVGAVKVAHHKP